MKKILALVLAALLVAVMASCAKVEKLGEVEPKAEEDEVIDVVAEAETEVEEEAEEVEAEAEEVEAEAEEDLNFYVDLLNEQGIETGVEGMEASFAARNNDLVIIFTVSEDLVAGINEETLGIIAESYKPLADSLVDMIPDMENLVLDFYTDDGTLIDSLTF